MSDTLNSRLLARNRLLAALSAGERQTLKPQLEKVSFAPGAIIYRAGASIHDLYFPLGGMASLLSADEREGAVEIAFADCKGVVGLPHAFGQKEMPHQVTAQLTTDCVRVESRIALNIFKKGGAFQNAVLRSVFLTLKQISQNCICSRYHSLEARLCRWLTALRERSADETLPLTKESLAQLLGVRRASIGIATDALQKRGIIRCHRSSVEIADLGALKENVCACYHVISAEYDLFRQEK